MTMLSLSAFAAGDQGGNPCTIAKGRWSSEDMLALARRKGHECCLFMRKAPGLYRLRFFAPTGEMDMCAHASLAAAWLLCAPDGPAIHMACDGGAFRAFKTGDGMVSISQPEGCVSGAGPAAALAALNITTRDLAPDHGVVNGTSTRTKTLVPIASADRLQSLNPDSDQVRLSCEALGSTGIYAWTATGQNQIEARQFPRSAGYHEDPATGVAAAALFFALGAPENGLTIDQGRAMGRLSRIRVDRDTVGEGCLLSGYVRALKPDEAANITAG